MSQKSSLSRTASEVVKIQESPTRVRAKKKTRWDNSVVGSVRDLDAMTVDRLSQDHSGTHPQTGLQISTYQRNEARYENTYRMEPDSKFDADRVEILTQDILTNSLTDVVYDAASCKQLSLDLAAKIKEAAKALKLRRYKLVAHVCIGSILDRPALYVSSRCLWNSKTDNYATVKFKNESLFAVVMLYGLYYE